MRNVAIVGVGQTKFGEFWEKSLKDLIIEAGNSAINDAKIDKKQIQALYIGNMSAGRFIGQEHIGALAADYLNLNPISATRCEGACASGSLAFREAYFSIASGKYDVVLAIGAEKMTDIRTSEGVATLATAGDQEYEASIGLTFAGLYALMARRHMYEFGTTQEQLALVSVNNHKNAIGNKYAQFQNEITVDDVLKSSLIAEPLHLLDCSPISDGAAAILLVSEEMAKKFEKPIWVLGSGQASDTLALHDRKSITEMLATKKASKEAFDQAGLTPKNIDLIEVHDCFSINEIICIEDLGFCKKGEGGKFVEEGKIRIDGEIPTNTTGGLKAIGHPVGATGIRQIIDIVRQLRGESHNQIKGAKFGLNLNIGGSGSTAVVNIFGSELNKFR
ncbi:MAG: thiolase domain-containing protein [Candidatus Aenigmatarchaeota archaeon]